MRSKIDHCSAYLLLTVALSGCAGMDKLDPLAAPKPQAQADKKEPDPALNSGSVRDQVRVAQMDRLQGQPDAAIKILSQVVLAAPDDPSALSEYGKALVAKGQTKDALAFLKRAIQLQPNDWTLYSAEGVAYDQFNDYPDAQLSFAQALALKPGDPTVLNNSAMSHLQVGDIAGAEELLAQAAPAAATQSKIAANIQMVRDLRDAHVTPDLSAMARANIAAAPVALAATPKPAAPAQSASAATAAFVPAPAPAPAPVVMAAIPAPTPAPVPVAHPPAKAEAKAPVKIASAPAPVAAKPAAKLTPAVVESPSASEGTTIFVQAGAYGSPESAGKVAQDLSRLGARVSPMVSNGHAIFRVRIGPFHDAKEADAIVADVQAAGHADVKIVRE